MQAVPKPSPTIANVRMRGPAARLGAGGTGRRVGGPPRVRLGQGAAAGRALPGRHPAERERDRAAPRISRTRCARRSSSSRRRGCSTSIPRRGALVVPISPFEADDVLCGAPAARAPCSRRAARGAGPAAGARSCGRAIAEQQAAPRRRRSGSSTRTLFHRAIVAATGNSFSWPGSTTRLRDRHQRIAATTLARDRARSERFLAEHRAIAAALERGDARLSGFALLGEHLRGAHELVRRGV